jgi:hypothetical protein
MLLSLLYLALRRLLRLVAASGVWPSSRPGRLKYSTREGALVNERSLTRDSPAAWVKKHGARHRDPAGWLRPVRPQRMRMASRKASVISYSPWSPIKSASPQ